MHAVLLLLPLTGWPPPDAGRELPWPRGENARVTVDDRGVLAVQGDAGHTQTRLLTLERPPVPSHHYRLVGTIKYENVEGAGYVELLNRFPGRGEYFTRTLDEGGALGKVTGSSDWRDLELPFLSEPGLLPDRLTVNLVLPGRGKVWITPLRIDALEGVDRVPNHRSVTWLLGLLFAAGAGVSALLGAFPRTRRLAVWLCAAFVVASLASLATGFLSWRAAEPTPYAMPMVLWGLLGVIVFAGGILLLKARRTRDERRRMRAMDVAAD